MSNFQSCYRAATESGQIINPAGGNTIKNLSLSTLNIDGIAHPTMMTKSTKSPLVDRLRAANLSVKLVGGMDSSGDISLVGSDLTKFTSLVAGDDSYNGMKLIDENGGGNFGRILDETLEAKTVIGNDSFPNES